MKFLNYSALIALSMGIASTSLAEDWPIWRGLNADGISKENVIPTETILWQKDIGNGFSCMSVKNGKLFAAGNHDDVDNIFCLNPETGEEIWKYSIDSPKGKDFWGPRSTPITDGKKVWFVTRHADLIALDFETGKEIWKRNLFNQKTPNPNWHIASSVVLYKDLAIVNIGSAGVAVNKDSGEIIWQSEGVSSYSSPALINIEGKDYVVFLAGQFVSVVDILSGDVISQVEWKQQGNISGATPLIIDNGKKIMISSGYRTGRSTMYSFDGKSLQELWTVKHMNCQFSTPIYFDGVIYGSNGNVNARKALSAISADTGELLWEGTLPFGSPLIAGDKLIYLDTNGNLSFLNIDKSKESIIKTVPILVAKNTQSWQMPIIANGYLYARNALGTLVCLKVK